MTLGLLEELEQAAGPCIVRQPLPAGDLYWRVRRLEPHEVVEAEAVSMALGGLRVTAERAADLLATGMPTTEESIAGLMRSRAIAMAAVDGVSRDGAEWSACRLVAPAEASAAAASVSVAVMDISTLFRAAAVAMSGVKEASEWVRPFRVGAGAG